MNKAKIISLIKKYGITFAVMIAATLAILYSFGYSSADPAYVRYLNLADAFTVPSVVTLLLGALVWISTTGFFDSIAYAVTIGIRALLPFMRRGKVEKYYDYKVRKDGKRIKGYGFLLISGAIYLIVALIFVMLFYMNY